jgi:hypothetical protein
VTRRATQPLPRHGRHAIFPTRSDRPSLLSLTGHPSCRAINDRGQIIIEIMTKRSHLMADLAHIAIVASALRKTGQQADVGMDVFQILQDEPGIPGDIIRLRQQVNRIGNERAEVAIKGVRCEIQRQIRFRIGQDAEQCNCCLVLSDIIYCVRYFLRDRLSHVRFPIFKPNTIIRLTASQSKRKI